MAYTPTLQDIPQEQGSYTPTLADLPAENNTGMLSRLWQSTGIPSDISNITAPGYTQRVLNSPPVNFFKGVGKGLLDTGLPAANFVLGTNLQVPQLNGSGIAYNVGDVAGNIGGFLAGGEALDAVRGLAEGIPLAGKIASYLGKQSLVPSVSRRALGASLYGAATDQNDPSGNAVKMGGISTALDLAPPALRAVSPYVSKIADAFKPQKLSDQIVQSLGYGRGLEDNAKSLARDISDSAQQQKAYGSSLYQPVFDRAGNNSIYRVNQSPDYINLKDSVFDNYDNDLSDLHDNFLQKPTFNNAHALKSQIGTSIRALERKDNLSGLDMSDRNSLQSLYKAKDAISSDMYGFLQKKFPDLANQYSLATKNWDQNVVPYIENPAISKIASGDVENPRNIASIFKNPEADTAKVINDLRLVSPQSAPNRILYSKLGQLASSSSPENLVRNYEKLDESGLNSYVTPQLSSQMDALNKRIIARNSLQSLGGIGLGAIAGLKISPEAAVGLGAVGGALSPVLSRYLGSTSLPDALSTAIKKSYPAARSAIIPNLNNSGAQQ